MCKLRESELMYAHSVVSLCFSMDGRGNRLHELVLPSSGIERLLHLLVA